MNVLSSILKANDYDVVHAYNSTMNVFSMCVAKKAKVPVRISESLSMAHKGEFKTVIKQMLKPMSKLFATHLTACGEDCGRWQFGKKAFNSGKVAIFKTVINAEANAFDPELRQVTRQEYGLDGKIVIGHIGRFVPQKNPLFLIDIFNEIHKLNNDAVLLLIGTGEEENKILRKIENLNLGNYVKFLGGREDIVQFYNAMDAFVLPSLYEGLPVVGLEAQSCGLPVIFSTEVTREVSAGGLSYFLDLNAGAKAWAKEILAAIESNKEGRRSYVKEVSVNGFDSDSEAKRLQRYYYDAIDRSGASK